MAVINRKGGVGKSTCAVNIAHGLALLGKKILLIDLDSQNDSALFLGIDREQYGRTFTDLFDRKQPASVAECIIPARDNLDLLPNRHLEQVESEFQKISRIDRILHEKLKDVESMGYDCVLIDCSPSRSKLNDAVLCYVDHVIMPVQLQAASVRAVGNIYGYLADLYLPASLISVVIPNQYNSVTRDSRENLQLLESFFADLGVLTEPIPTRTRITEAGKAGQTIFEYDPEMSETFIPVLRKVVALIEK